MTAISISLSGVTGVDWPRWQRLATEVEALGFAGLYRYDHFAAPYPMGVPENDSLDLTASLTWLASHTKRIRFGPLVAPFSIREPHLLVRQATAIDDLSGGRFVLGVGAGWMEREHTMFGYDLGDIPTRMARFEEGLQVVTGLLRSPEPFTFAGRFFQMREATVMPRPQRPHGPPLLVGGKGPKRSLPLVARYADIWNVDFLPADVFRERSALLDQLLIKEGRQPGAVKRTAAVRVFCGQDLAELEQRLSGLRPYFPAWATLSSAELLEKVRQTFSGSIIGTPEEVVAQLRAYTDGGLDELMLHWTVSGDIEGLRLLAEYILPHFAT
ncbi:MAG: LLM class flavin-dependent oxidoreductase [Caldilinea sp. CFX5]|nr:LLM class flavin-dependent oxidoreductase [Caldilinea sp. CFX5]